MKQIHQPIIFAPPFVALCFLLFGGIAQAAPFSKDLAYKEAKTHPSCVLGFTTSSAFKPCRVLVQFADYIAPSNGVDIIHRRGGKIFHSFKKIRGAAVFVPNYNAWVALRSDAAIKRIIPDREVHVIAKPANPGNKNKGATGEQLPKGVERIGANNSLYKGSGVGIAILDTGVDINNADLSIASDCYTSFADNCNDIHGHGTHVSGISAAIEGNNIGVIGVAPEAQIHAAKVLDDTGSGSDASIIAGLEWVLDQKNSGAAIHVANMSLGRPGSIGDNPLLHQAIINLTDAGVSVVVAAGNSSTAVVSGQIPAAYPEVIAVASTTAETGNNRCNRLNNAIAADTASYFTTDGTGVLISAPGAAREDVNRGCRISSIGILSLQPGGGTARMSGTSMAAPHVAGVVAQLIDRNGTTDTVTIKSQLTSGAELVGSAPYNSPTSGYSFDGIREGILSSCGSVGC
ncbi:MAG: S8 family serine peptidase [Motiliproteus sp.]